MVLKKIVVIVCVLQLFSCTGSKSENYQVEEEIVVDAKSLYVIHCESCHGLDGKKGTSGAADLSISKLDDKQILSVIENGNNKGMMPYKNVISSKKERLSLVEFVKTLRK
jgi:mono/diheme cytochrome c family protein